MEKINTSFIDEELKDKLNKLIEENEKLINEKEKKEAEIKKAIQKTERNHDNTTSDIMKQQANIQKKKLQTELGDTQRDFDERINENKEKIKNLIEQAKEQIQKEKNDAEGKMNALKANINKWANSDKTKKRLACKKGIANLIVDNTKMLQDITEPEEREKLEKQIETLKNEMNYGAYTSVHDNEQLNSLKQTAKERNACYEKVSACLDELDKLDEIKEEIGIEDKDFYQQNKKMFDEKVDDNKLKNYRDVGTPYFETEAMSKKREELENKITELSNNIEDNYQTDYTQEIEAIQSELNKFFMSVKSIINLNKKYNELWKNLTSFEKQVFYKLCNSKAQEDVLAIDNEMREFDNYKLKQNRGNADYTATIDEYCNKFNELYKTVNDEAKNELKKKFQENSGKVSNSEDLEPLGKRIDGLDVNELLMISDANAILSEMYKIMEKDEQSRSQQDKLKEIQEALDKYVELCNKTKQKFDDVEMYEKEIDVFRSDFEDPLNEWRQKPLEDISLDHIKTKYDYLKVRLEVYDKNVKKCNPLGAVVEAKEKEIKKTYSQESEGEKEVQKFRNEFRARCEEIENILENFGKEEIDDAKLNKLIEDIKSYSFEKEPPKQEPPKQEPPKQVVTESDKLTVAKIDVNVKAGLYTITMKSGDEIKIPTRKLSDKDKEKEADKLRTEYGISFRMLDSDKKKIEANMRDAAKNISGYGTNNQRTDAGQQLEKTGMLDPVIAAILVSLDYKLEQMNKDMKDTNKSKYRKFILGQLPETEDSFGVTYDFEGVKKVKNNDMIDSMKYLEEIGKKAQKAERKDMLKNYDEGLLSKAFNSTKNMASRVGSRIAGLFEKNEAPALPTPEQEEKIDDTRLQHWSEEIEKLTDKEEKLSKIEEAIRYGLNQKELSIILKNEGLQADWEARSAKPKEESKEEKKGFFARIRDRFSRNKEADKEENDEKVGTKKNKRTEKREKNSENQIPTPQEKFAQRMTEGVAPIDHDAAQDKAKEMAEQAKEMREQAQEQEIQQGE